MRWRAGADHRVAIRLERGVEVGRLVGLDPVDDGRLVGVGVDLAGGRGARRAFLLELLPAELEDRVGVETVERAQADHLVVLLAPDRPVVGAVGERALEPARVQLDGDLGRLARALEAALLGGRQDVRRRPRRVSSKKVGSSRRGLDLDPLPEPDLRDRSRGSSIPRGRWRSPRAGRRSRRAARGAARGRGRTAGTGCRRRGRARTSDAPRCGGRPRRRSPGGRCGARARARSAPRRRAPPGRSPRPRRGARDPRPARRGQPPGSRRRAGRRPGGARATCPGPGCRGRAAEARLDEVVEARRRAARATPRAPGAGAARQVVARSSGCDLRRAGRAARVDSWRGAARSRSRPSRDPCGRSGWCGHRHRAGLGERGPRGSRSRLDVGGGHPIVGHGADLPVGIFHHHDIPRPQRGEECRPVALDPEDDEVRAHASRVQRSGRRLGGPARARRCRRCRRAPRPAGGRWRGPRRGVRSSRRGRRDSATSPAAARTPTWRIPPPTSLRARRARQMNSRDPTTTEPTGQASALRQAERDGVGRIGQVARRRTPRATTAFQNRAPSMWSGTPCAWAIARDLARVGRASAAGPSSGRGCSRA